MPNDKNPFVIGRFLLNAEFAETQRFAEKEDLAIVVHH